MGGGHVSRPDFGLGRLDRENPMAEFYLFLQDALSRSPEFALPGAYVAFAPPPGQKLYADTIREHCTFSHQAQPGFLEIFPPQTLRLARQELSIAPNGAPAALLLAGEMRRGLLAVQLLPPMQCPGEGLPPVPECAAALSLRLTDADVLAIDAEPAALRHALRQDTCRKRWLEHPKIEQWLRTALAAAQRAASQGG